MQHCRRTFLSSSSPVTNELYEKGIVTEKDLLENEKFFTTLVHASGIAIKNHESKKLEALRNAVVNSALPGALDDTIQQLFLNVIDSCTSWHISLLQLFQGPTEWAKNHNQQLPQGLMMGSLSAIIESAFPQLKGGESIYRLIWQELYRDGFISSDSVTGRMSGAGLIAKRTTDLGDRFLAFISQPKI